MAESEKTIDDSQLETASGGLSAEQKEALRNDLLALIPENVRGKLAMVRGNVEACKLLAENGVDVEKIEKKIKDAYASAGKDLLSMTEKELEKISGGIVDKERNLLYCDCGNGNEDEFSYQFFVSQLMGGNGRSYRCEKCGEYVLIKNGYRRQMTAGEYKNWHFYQDF